MKRKKPTVPRYFSERSDQSILLSTIRECLYFKLPQGSRKFINAYVFLSCLYLKFLPLVYSNVFDIIRELFERIVHCYLESWPQTGKFDLFFSLWISKHFCHLLTLYLFNEHVFSIWLVYSTVLGAEETMLSKVYVIDAFCIFNLVGQTDNHTSSHGESTGLVNHSDFPKCCVPSHSRGLISFLQAL